MEFVSLTGQQSVQKDTSGKYKSEDKGSIQISSGLHNASCSKNPITTSSFNHEIIAKYPSSSRELTKHACHNYRNTNDVLMGDMNSISSCPKWLNAGYCNDNTRDVLLKIEVDMDESVKFPISVNEVSAKETVSCDVTDQSCSRNEKTLLLHTRKVKKLYKCDTCNKIYTWKYELSRHMNMHTKEKWYCCNVCNKQFYLKHSFTKHMNIHTKEKVYTCDICNKTFTDSSSFRRHHNIHTKKKVYTCTECDREFTIKCNLTAHMNIHTREKVFICQVCNKQYIDRSGLRYHLKTNHLKSK